jgi:hypothetical protein
MKFIADGNFVPASQLLKVDPEMLKSKEKEEAVIVAEYFASLDFGWIHTIMG